MATEKICIEGSEVETLVELLRPGLRFIVVGLNPSPVSVKAGHYYQGRLGQQFFRRLQHSGIVGPLPVGREDEVAFEYGVGFADLVRRPTPRGSKGLTRIEVDQAVPDLLNRLGQTGDKPPLLFVFRSAFEAAETALSEAGYILYQMPHPRRGRREDVQLKMARLRENLGGG
jgi:TDG/mug DNA glycosylase family protein